MCMLRYSLFLFDTVFDFFTRNNKIVNSSVAKRKTILQKLLLYMSLINFRSSLRKQCITVNIIGYVESIDHNYLLTSRQTREKLQCLYENMWNNFRRTAVLKKKMNCKLQLHS